MRLLDYTERNSRAKFWKNPDDLAGKEIGDIVQNIVTKTLAFLQTGNSGDGYRRWDGSKELLYHLMDVIDSELYNLATSKSHQTSVYKDQDAWENQFKQGENQENNLLEQESSELNEKLLEKIQTACEDDEEASLVLMAMEEMKENGLKLSNKFIGEHLGWSADTVRNAIRRIKRKAGAIRQDHFERKEGSDE